MNAGQAFLVFKAVELKPATFGGYSVSIANARFESPNDGGDSGPFGAKSFFVANACSSGAKHAGPVGSIATPQRVDRGNFGVGIAGQRLCGMIGGCWKKEKVAQWNDRQRTRDRSDDLSKQSTNG